VRERSSTSCAPRQTCPETHRIPKKQGADAALTADAMEHGRPELQSSHASHDLGYTNEKIGMRIASPEVLMKHASGSGDSV
jgi:hypothetical protein